MWPLVEKADLDGIDDPIISWKYRGQEGASLEGKFCQ